MSRFSLAGAALPGPAHPALLEDIDLRFVQPELAPNLPAHKHELR
jgi:hypothetical protein